MKLIRCFFWSLASLLPWADVSAVCFVNQAANGKNDGTSWIDAYSNPQLALLTGCDEIWVAKGVYKPSTKGNPDISFIIPAGTKLYGGFIGSEAELGAANPAVNVTVLSGDIDNNDTTDSNHITIDAEGDNSYHVVRLDGTIVSGASVTNSTVLSGFIITGGDAEGDDVDGYGGGLYCDGSGFGGVCNPTLSKLIFAGNIAYYGAAIFNNGNSGESSPRIDNTEFVANWSGYLSSGSGPGTAIYNWGCCSGKSSPTITNATFAFNNGWDNSLIENDGTSGGDSSPTFTNSTLFANGNDPLVRNRGYGPGSNSSPLFINVTMFRSFTAIDSNGRDGGASSPTIVNSVIDSDGFTSNPLVIDAANVIVDHSVLRGGCPAAATCTSIFDADSMTSSLGNHGGFTRTLIPLISGAAINNGATCFFCPTTDQRGVNRVDGQPDIGAFEWSLSDEILFKDGFERPPSF